RAAQQQTRPRGFFRPPHFSQSVLAEGSLSHVRGCPYFTPVPSSGVGRACKITIPRAPRPSLARYRQQVGEPRSSFLQPNSRSACCFLTPPPYNGRTCCGSILRRGRHRARSFDRPSSEKDVRPWAFTTGMTSRFRDTALSSFWAAAASARSGKPSD